MCLSGRTQAGMCPGTLRGTDYSPATFSTPAIKHSKILLVTVSTITPQAFLDKLLLTFTGSVANKQPISILQVQPMPSQASQTTTQPDNLVISTHILNPAFSDSAFLYRTKQPS